ncbi:MAG: sugar phosphate isomerase/epimerase [Chitinophagaceae bacterium]
MTTRRDFIKLSTMLTTGLVVEPTSFLFKDQHVGLGLYTMRNELAKDVKGTLSRVAELGFTQVETFGYNGKFWNLSATEFLALLKSLKLTSPSGHYYPAGFFMANGWEDKWKAAADDAALVGQKYIVVPWMEESYRKSLDNYKKLAVHFSKAAEISKQKGLGFAYHNHDFEFESINGQTGFDILLKETSPSVKFEMDVYWVRFAGKDPVELIKRNPGRFPLWHVKDMDKTSKKYFTEVGNGVIDFKKLFANAKTSGMKYFFVEQDNSPGSPFDSIKQSIGYLKKNIVK